MTTTKDLPPWVAVAKTLLPADGDIRGDASVGGDYRRHLRQYYREFPHPHMANGPRSRGETAPRHRHDNIVERWIQRRRTDGERRIPLVAYGIQTDWSGPFLSACLNEAGVAAPRGIGTERAFLEGWGRELDRPKVGCVVLFSRGTAMIHCGFLLGLHYINEEENALGFVIIGGNHRGITGIGLISYEQSLDGWRWPSELPVGEDDGYEELPFVTLDGEPLASFHEAVFSADLGEPQVP